MSNHWEVLKNGKIVVSETPEGLMEQAFMYFSWCDDNPIEVERAVTQGKKTGESSKQKIQRPYSVKGLCIHCGILEEYIRDLSETKDKDSMWYIVVSRILYIIYVQNHELATVGVYSPIFTAKILNIGQDDAPNRPIRVEHIGNLPPLSNSESEVLEKLKLENDNPENA